MCISPSFASLLAAALLLLDFGAVADGQPTACAPGTPAGYEGPCYYGALPAFFDDFAYTSAALPAMTPNSGSLFGLNAWALRDGTVQTRGWYRYNRHDLPMPGTITFEDTGVMAMRLPEGLAYTTMTRDQVIQTGVTLAAGTYCWRVRLSPHWPGQWLRQSVWLIAPEQFYFDRLTPHDSTRYAYASELDFENENHFQGEHIGERFEPDFVTRMTVTNLVGQVHDARGLRQLSYEGPVAWPGSQEVLARAGVGRPPRAQDAPEATWSDRWLYLTLVVDNETRTVTYRMLPAEPHQDDPMQDVVARPITIGEAFYPSSPMAAAFSLHWVHPEGILAHTLSLEADWFYHTPVVGLSINEVLQQAALLRDQELIRVNTTDRPTFELRNEPGRLEAEFEGPERVTCGRPATWTLRVTPGGSRYVTSFRYRLLDADGTPGTWQTVYAPTLTLTPQRGQAGAEMEATLQDLWAPDGTTILPNGWHIPRPNNYAAATSLLAHFECDR